MTVLLPESQGDITGGLLGDSYGYRFTVGGEAYHDLMAYDDPNITGTQTTIPYYSNPDVLYQGVPTGVAGSANAARAIRSAAPAVAKYRSTKVPSSTPTTLKLSTSVSTAEVSQAITLTATITKKNASQQTPAGTVTFYDGATILDTVDVASSKAIWTGMLGTTGGHNLRAVYVADDFFGGSISAVKTVSCYQVSLGKQWLAERGWLGSCRQHFRGDGARSRYSPHRRPQLCIRFRGVERAAGPGRRWE